MGSIRIKYIFRNNGEEDIECELMQMFFGKKMMNYCIMMIIYLWMVKKIIINQKFASFDWGEKKHIPVVEKKFVVEKIVFKHGYFFANCVKREKYGNCSK